MPPAALILGVLGLIPFWGAAALYAFGDPNQRGVALLTLLAYSAAILSFLGGVRWGMEIAAGRRPRAWVLVLSTLPPIAAWLLLAGGGGASLTEVQSLGGFLLAFVVQGVWDVRASDAPPWRRRLRLWLTVAAVLALGLALGTTLGAGQ
ncbi:MAG: DUF3429 domain-containing protein [Pseudomonadota bacterium]|nr:DUF3429 domain-containing protein [Pseudomonadota bacterium]